MRRTGRTTAALRAVLLAARMGKTAVYVVHNLGFVRYCIDRLKELTAPEEVDIMSRNEVRLVGGGRILFMEPHDRNLTPDGRVLGFSRDTPIGIDHHVWETVEISPENTHFLREKT